MGVPKIVVVRKSERSPWSVRSSKSEALNCASAKVVHGILRDRSSERVKLMFWFGGGRYYPSRLTNDRRRSSLRGQADPHGVELRLYEFRAKIHQRLCSRASSMKDGIGYAD